MDKENDNIFVLLDFLASRKDYNNNREIDDILKEAYKDYYDYKITKNTIDNYLKVLNYLIDFAIKKTYMIYKY